MPWNYKPELEIKGVATRADLLARPQGSPDLEKHLIVPDASQINLGWIGQQFDAVVKTLPISTHIIISQEDRPNQHLDASDLFFASFKVIQSNFKSINISHSAMGQQNIIADSETEILSHSSSHSLVDIEGNGGGHIKGLILQDSKFSTVSISWSTHRDIFIRDARYQQIWISRIATRRIFSFSSKHGLAGLA